MKGNPYRTLGAERAHREFLESRGVVPEPQVKLSRRACALMDALQFLAKGDPDADLWIPHKAGQELLDAGLVARTMQADGRVTYRLTAAGRRWRAA